MWKFRKEDGTLLDAAYINGYGFGERLLEGVIFKVAINEDMTFNVTSVDDPNKGYLGGLNMVKWLELAVNYASRQDIFAELPSGYGEDVVVYDTETGIECPNCTRGYHG
jgi:hypothetical protein